MRAACEGGLLSLALHSACSFAPRQEQSRYPASAAHDNIFAGRSAPCNALPTTNVAEVPVKRGRFATLADCLLKALSLLLLASNFRLVISLWACRSCPNSSHVPPRLRLSYCAEMYFAALPLVAV